MTAKFRTAAKTLTSAAVAIVLGVTAIGATAQPRPDIVRNNDQRYETATTIVMTTATTAVATTAATWIAATTTAAPTLQAMLATTTHAAQAPTTAGTEATACHRRIAQEAMWWMTGAATACRHRQEATNGFNTEETISW